MRNQVEKTLAKWPAWGATECSWTLPVPGSSHVQVIEVSAMVPPHTSGSSS